MKMKKIARRFVGGFVCAWLLLVAAAPARGQSEQQRLADIKRVFVEPMPHGFDEYLIAALTKQLAGRITIVTSKDDADAVMKGGTTAEANGTPSTVARRVLGMDLTTGAISLISRDGKTVLWASEAGDKSVLGPFYRRTGQRKVAERLAKDLKKALNK